MLAENPAYICSYMSDIDKRKQAGYSPQTLKVRGHRGKPPFSASTLLIFFRKTRPHRVRGHRGRKGLKPMESNENKIPRSAPLDWANPETIDPAKVGARLSAIYAGAKFFFFNCADCGRETPHDLSYGACAACYPGLQPEILRRGQTFARILARRANARYFNASCPKCGPGTPHHVRNGKCGTCFTAAGHHKKTARPFPLARREAELSRLPRYEYDCLLHGRTAHHTRRGLCLECFDTQGHPREPIYMAFCSPCGHLTMHEIVTRGCTACSEQAAAYVNSRPPCSSANRSAVSCSRNPKVR